MLPDLTMSQSLTVATTGKTFQAAQPGRGTITFYNAATDAPQTIVAGTLIKGKDGTQVVTDYTIRVPVAILPTFGTARVTAHTLVTGLSGNIPANDINGSCCLENIEAQNSAAFLGGQDATTYQSVAQTDIDTEAAKLQTVVNQSVIAAFQAQVQPNESLVTPPPCRQPIVNADHAVGDKATQIQVSVQETCTGLTYNTEGFQQHIRHMQALAHYQLQGTLQTTLQSVSIGDDSYTLTMKNTTVWAYQFSSNDLARMASHIAGMDEKQATFYLLHTTGVQHVSFNNAGTLPTDGSRIHFLFLTQQV